MFVSLDYLKNKFNLIKGNNMSNTTTNQVINLSAENIKLLKEYKQEAFSAFADLEIANQQMKDILNAAHEKTGIEKKDIKCFFSLAYKAKTEQYLSQAALIEALNK